MKKIKQFIPKLRLLLFLLLFNSSPIIAQIKSEIIIEKENSYHSLSNLISDIVKNNNIDILFEDKSVLKKKLPSLNNSIELITYLRALLPEKYIVVPNRKIVLVLDKHINLKESYIGITSKKANNYKCQVYDELTGKTIEGANVYFTKNRSGTITDKDGKFVKESKNDIIVVNVSFIGYKKRKLILVKSKFNQSKTILVPLEVSYGMLLDVMVSAEKRDENISVQKIGVQKVSMEAIKEIPTFLGEIDPIKAITTMPGVSTGGDMSAGFSVRGGNNSQNLILQDGAIIFNPTHLFGFFSAFNPDFISELEMLKGGGPVEYGGRVSSVLNIRSKNGSMNNYKTSIGIGLISSRLNIEGPVVKDKSSFIIGGRLSYSNWFIKSFDDIKLKNSSTNFHDLTAKFTQKISDKSIISITGYYSADSFNLAIDSTFNWSTKNVSLNWNYKHTKKTKSDITIANSNYSSSVLYNNEINGFDYSNGINVTTLNYKLRHQLNPKTNLTFGSSNNFSILNPGKSIPNNEYNNGNIEELQKQKTIESAFFAGGNIDISDKLNVDIGLRFSNFIRLGEDQIYSLDYNNLDGRTASISDTTFYSKNEIVSYYNNLEPRISLRYLLSDNSSIKVGYSKMSQYLHQVSASTQPSPVDFWISSSPNIKPQVGNQISLGYFQNYYDQFLEFSLETFYKTTDNTIDYIAGVDLHMNQNLEAALTQGDGYSYGLEFLLKRKEGKLNGWIAYTYSRSYQIMKGESPELAINDGDPYPSIFDQPHQLTVMLNYRLSNRIILSSNFTYNSGRPITIPEFKYSYDKYLSILNYSKRNEYRMPDYHRLDLSLTIRSQKKPNRRYNSEVIISLYNVYARKNAYSIYFDNSGTANKTYILGTIFPSISLNLNFE